MPRRIRARDLAKKLRFQEEPLEPRHYAHLITEVTAAALSRKPLTQLISAIVHHVGTILKVSRVYVFRYDRLHDTVTNIAEWTAQGIAPWLNQYKDFPAKTFPLFRARMIAGTKVRIENVATVPDPALREVLREQNVRSFLALPIVVFNQPYGFLGFDDCTRVRRWTAQEVALLKAVSRVLVQAIEKERWEAEVVRAERFAALGRFAGVLAHEVNNPLQGILLNVDLLKSAFPHNDQVERRFERIQQDIARIADMMGNILQLVRDRQEPQRIDLGDLVQGTVTFLRRTIEQLKITVIATCGASPMVQGQRTLLHQALMNIMLNAVESMVRKGGVLTLTMRVHEGRAEVVIEDAGEGMTKEQVAHVGEPFFTLKGEGRPGLGFFIAHLIVHDHGGNIAVESARGRGTRVTVTLPQAP